MVMQGIKRIVQAMLDNFDFTKLRERNDTAFIFITLLTITDDIESECCNMFLVEPFCTPKNLSAQKLLAEAMKLTAKMISESPLANQGVLYYRHGQTSYWTLRNRNQVLVVTVISNPADAMLICSKILDCTIEL
jgi:hypothetical protein